MKAQPERHTIRFPDGAVLDFHYRVVQLNRLPWWRFVRAHNPIASALMARTKVAPRDRPKVKLECLRLLVTLRLDPARMHLIAAFVDSYLRLSANEDVVFRRSLGKSDKAPKAQADVVEFHTSWELRGEVLLDILTSRFAVVAVPVVARIQEIRSPEELQDLTRRALRAESLAELNL